MVSKVIFSGSERYDSRGPSPRFGLTDRQPEVSRGIDCSVPFRATERVSIRLGLRECQVWMCLAMKQLSDAAPKR